ncbi:MAG: hypothetical protein KA297_05920 [Kofleriaceae bacterium]|nr:hypothetical protein [Kofleriaceae bacterium]
MASLLHLGDRYRALGLWAAARAAYARARAGGDPDGAAALRLAELALDRGDGAGAVADATAAVSAGGGVDARLLLGRAQLVSKELGAARRSYAAVLDARAAPPLARAAAHLGLARAAQAGGDGAGALANTSEALTVLASVPAPPLALAEEVCALLVTLGGGAEAQAQLAAGPTDAGGVLAALLGNARASHRDGVDDASAITALTAAAAVGGPGLTLRALERAARAANGPELVTLIRALAALVEDAPAVVLAPLDQARAWFTLAGACERAGADQLARAEAAYRRGLALRPTEVAATTRLALLLLARGDEAGAIDQLERALRVDAGLGGTWRQAARMLDAALAASSGAPAPALRELVVRLLDAANPGAGALAGAVAPRLVSATAEVARDDLLAGVYAHGHRVKNLLGVIGSRTRSARKLADGTLADRLRELERDVQGLYEEWAQYLRSMQSVRPVLETVPVAALVQGVVVAAQAKTPVPITVELEAALPDLRGDRMLLGEVVHNLVGNAAEACLGPGGAIAGEVRVGVRALVGAGAPRIEIVVNDTGAGIPRAHLVRILAPGYTTKDTGSGLGLTIAERIVSAHQGRLLIDSEEGRGTTVVVTLPTDLVGVAALSLVAGPRGGDPDGGAP